MSLRIEEFLEHFVKEFGAIAIESEVSTDLEVSAIAKQFDRAESLVILRKLKNFENFVGLLNLINTRSKLRRLLCVESDEQLYEKILRAEERCDGGFIEVSSFDYKELNVDLYKLPIARFYPGEPRPYLTSAVVIGALADGSILNASIHRLSILSRDKLVIRLVPRHLFKIWQMNKERGFDTPVAIVWTINPVVLLAAACSPAFGKFELRMIEHLYGVKPKVCYIDGILPVPVDAEVVLIGRILRDGTAPEGPFVDVLQLYDEVREQPIVKIDRVYVRADRDIRFTHYIVPGLREHQLLMGIEKEAKIWKFVKNVVPEVKAVRLTPGSGGWLHAIISIKKYVEGDAKNAILAAFAAHPSLKHVVVVDDDVDVDNLEDVEWAIATRFRADRDLVVICHVRGSTLDPSAIDQATGLTCKVGIDATRPLSDRKFDRARIVELEEWKLQIRKTQDLRDIL